MVNFELFSESVLGFSHIRKDMPNQDSIGTKTDDSNYYILSVSDGHGSESCFRSDIGSKIAIEETIKVLYNFYEQVKDLDNNSLKNILDTGYSIQLKRDISNSWKKSVKEDSEKNPFNDSDQNKIKDDIYRCYGATLISVLLTKKFVMYLQLGDGDIVRIKNNKSEFIFTNEVFMGNETESLCFRNSERFFNLKITFIESDEDFPDFILACTDGYSNSYSTDDIFLGVIQELYKCYNTKSMDYLKNNLKSWLNEDSEKGSGDDISVGIIAKKNNFEEKKEQIIQSNDELSEDKKIKSHLKLTQEPRLNK